MTAAVSSARVAEHAQTPARRLLTVRELAELLGTSPDFVYRHSVELGALRLPGRDAGRGRLRFHWPTTAALLESVRSVGEKSQPGGSPVPAAVTPLAPTADTPVRLVPAREVDGA